MTVIWLTVIFSEDEWSKQKVYEMLYTCIYKHFTLALQIELERFRMSIT